AAGRRGCRPGRRSRTPRPRADGRCPPAAARCPPRALPARDLRPDRGAGAGRAVDAQPAVQRLDAIEQAAQPGTPAGIGATPAVITNLHDCPSILSHYADADTISTRI